MAFPIGLLGSTFSYTAIALASNPWKFVFQAWVCKNICIFAIIDVLTTQQRHNNMASIRSANTKPEILVRKYLWNRGFRYRLNNPRLPGHPDIVLRKYRTCVFVNGCFWHGHDGSKYFRMPKTNTDFGRRRSSATGNGIRKSNGNWQRWDGTASRCGSVSWNQKFEIRRLSHLPIHSITYSSKIAP